MLFGILVCLAKISQWRRQRRPKERGSIILYGRWQNDEWITRSDISWITRRDISAKFWRIEQDFFHRIIGRTRTRGSTLWREKVFLATERYRIARRIESIGGIVIQSAGTKSLTTPRGTYKVAGDNWKSSFFVTKILGGCKGKRKKKRISRYSWDVVIHLTSHRSGNTLDVEMCKLQGWREKGESVRVGRTRGKRGTTVIRRRRRWARGN